MILVLLGICIIVVVVSVLLVTYDICDDEICFCSIVVFGIGFLICIGALFYFLHSVIDVKFVKDKIAMYEEQNSKIEEQIDVVVKQYMEYESDTYAMTAPESSITLVSLYPELKSDELVKKQIAVYQENNKKITNLKEKQIDANVAKWWLYFGG